MVVYREANRTTTMQRTDTMFRYTCLGGAALALLLLAGILAQLGLHSAPAWQHFGFSFLWGSDWDPATDSYGALPHILGTLHTTAISHPWRWPWRSSSPADSVNPTPAPPSSTAPPPWNTTSPASASPATWSASPTSPPISAASSSTSAPAASPATSLTELKIDY